MKKIVCVFLVIPVLSLLASTKNVSLTSQNDEVIELDITFIPPVTGPIRNPTLIPITALYYVSFSYIDVDFLDNLGSVSITLTNQTTNGTTTMQVNSSFGGVLVPVTLDSGYYHITFVAQGGASYESYLNVY